MSSVAIIIARGGSKRIPKKNIKEFCGKPIIAYSIEAAINSQCFNEVMVSTDDEEIASIARKYGATIPFMRSSETSNDYATMADVLLEVLMNYKKMGHEFEYHCCIYPTAPFVTADKLIEGMNLIKQTGAEEVCPFTRFNVPPQWRATVDNNGFVSFSEPDKIRVRSQDLEPMYYDPGQFYVYNTKKFIENGAPVVIENQVAIIVPENEVQDIDTIEDWEMAEIKYKLMMAKRS